jgi:endoglucanase
MKYPVLFLTVFTICFEANSQPVPDGDVHIRINQVGYKPGDQKVAVLFSAKPVKGNFQLVEEQSGRKVFTARIAASPAPGYGPFKYYYLADFTAVRTEGIYKISISSLDNRSWKVVIDQNAYTSTPADLLTFMRQLRCGYNPLFDAVCHSRDGRLMDGPEPDSTYIDVTGGWHDAGDQLKYLITASNATARMLMSYLLFPGSFDDRVNALGQPGNNGVADILDEARWGLDWIHKLHYGTGKLVHQVADDRDHRGWKTSEYDPADYGWGKNSYRVAYFATGKPQGLGKYKSNATGVSNLAGRSAAAMALGYQVFQSTEPGYAQECLDAALDLYAMAKAKEGFQQGNSFGAPYRYNEDTWTDDMEWAAAELFKATRNDQYLVDAKKYATATATQSWIERDTTAHYQFYPFLNIAHFELHTVADEATKKVLEGYYRDGIEQTLQRANRHAFGNGVPFVWCSNNLLVDLILQIVLYERMSGDKNYHGYMLGMRDWLFGRNPWGVSMFTSIPQGGFSARDVHTSTWALFKQEIPGGLVDGPIYSSIYKNLLGLTLTKKDSLAPFQNEYVVYHDDIGDYSTNEPTMDGTACAIMLMAYLAAKE